MAAPVKIFHSYAHADDALHKKLRTHLSPLVRKGIVQLWHDHDITAGAPWDVEIQAKLDEADIILLEITADFIASDYCYSNELEWALERHEKHGVKVIPVFMRKCNWGGLAFAKFQGFPRGDRAVAQWPDQDEALTEVVAAIEKVAITILARGTVQTPPVAPQVVVAELRAGEVRQGPVDGQAYVWIPPGEFEMGASPEDEDAGENEKPRHRVRITKGFWLMQTPVTVESYGRFLKATGRSSPPEPRWKQTAEHPVVNVSWDDAQAFAKWAGGRLPREAEWEYAARAGTTERYLGERLDDLAWYGGNSGGKAHAVGLKKANQWGLHDVLGNAWEWCEDWYGSYGGEMQEDPTGPERGSGRVLRGGSWGNRPQLCRVSCRGGGRPGSWGVFIGVRVLREVIP